MRLLTKEEYEATFHAPMVSVTANAEEIVDLWAYADPIIEAEYHNCTSLYPQIVSISAQMLC